MAIRSLRHVSIIDQDFSKDGKVVEIRNATRQFVIDLIKDCANPTLLGTWHKPTVAGIPFYYQKLLLSHAVSEEDYERYCTNDLMTSVGVNSHKDEMQRLIDLFFQDAHKELTSERPSIDIHHGYKDDFLVDIDGSTNYMGKFYE